MIKELAEEVIMRRDLAMVLAAVFFGLVSGAPVLAQTVEASNEKWQLVYIGDSWLPRAAQFFGERIETDLDVEVSTTQRNAGVLAFATSAMRNGQWNVLKNTDVVVVHIDGPTSVEGGYCLDVMGDRAYGVEPAAFRAEVEAFLAELTRLANPESTIIRIGLIAIMPKMRGLWSERGVSEDCTARWIELNKQWTAAAAAYGVTTVDVLAAWNGPDGRSDAPLSYFSDDVGHLTDEGAMAVVELMREKGYAPLAP